MLKVDIKKRIEQFDLNLSFEANKGVLGILGASGSGKSMSLKTISGIIEPDMGEIVLDDKIFFSTSKKINIQPRHRNIGYLFQNYALFPHYTVFQNIAYGINKLPKDIIKSKVRDIISKLGLNEFEKKYPSQLSGGQQQRVALARALVVNPSILMLDEPFSALDSHIKNRVEKEFINIIKNSFDGVVLFVTHNIEEAYNLCDNIMVIDKGKNIQIDTKELLIKKPKSVMSAKITGCKNIFEAEITDNQKIYVKDWREELKLKDFQNSFTHIGIRANNISLCYRENSNKIKCRLNDVLETPFRITLFMTPIMADNNKVVIQCEVSKNHWEKFKNSNNIYELYLQENDIFLM